MSPTDEGKIMDNRQTQKVKVAALKGEPSAM